MRRSPRNATQSAPGARQSTTRYQRLYGSQAWRRASERFRASPEGALCRLCRERGKLTAAEAVDHIVPHNGDLTLFWDEANWMPVCWACHSAKTRADETEARTGRRPLLRGCGVDGIPLDKRHHWRRET